MRTLRVIAFIPLWLVTWLAGTFFVWLPLWAVGVVKVYRAAKRKEYHEDTLEGWQGPCYRWNDDSMYLWETFDNGCCPLWYIRNYGPSRPLWKNIWIWSAFRNAVGGNPMHERFVATEDIEIYGDFWPSKSTTDHFHETGKRKWFWRMIRHGWRVGIWGSLYIGTKEKWRVLDIQHGFKRQFYMNRLNDEISFLNFSPWDSGRRSK